MMAELCEATENWPGAALISQNGLLLALNQRARRLTSGLQSVEGGLHLQDVLPGAEFELRGDERVRFDCTLFRRFGLPAVVHVAAQPVVRDGRPAWLMLILEREQALDYEDPAIMRAESILEALPEATAITNGRTVVHVNREFTRLFGWTLEECIGKDMTELVIPEGRYHEREMMLHMVQATGRCEMDTVRRTRAGEQLDVSVRGLRVELGGEAFGILATYRDIREEKQKQAVLAFSARHDGLTGLPNRVQFLEKIEMMLGRLKRRPDHRFAVIFLDLDGFKKVNDTLGHAAGDELLIQVAARLTACLRPQDAVARFGGDEFALLLDESGGRDKVESVVLRLQEEIQRPLQLRLPHSQGEGIARVAGSMGVVLVDPGQEGAETILADADRAMYQAKAAGRGCHVFAEGDRRRGQGRRDAMLGFPHGFREEGTGEEWHAQGLS